MIKPDLSSIPLDPGVYLFKSEQGKILYVGKAKHLRKRLASYFRPEESLAPKTRSMLEKAASLETIKTATENEALLLEASLIKKHRPRYNIVLRDDKEYVLFRLDTTVPYPRLEIVRQVRRSKSRRAARVFGPFSSGRDAKFTWKAIHKAFHLRRCTDRSFKNRAKACLYFHIGQCPAPCVLPVSPEQYGEQVNKVIMLLEGRSRELIHDLRRDMLRASEQLNFELAAQLRDQLHAVENTVEKQSVVLERELNQDMIGLAEGCGGLCLGLLFVRGGALLGSRNYFWPGLHLEDAAELLSSFLLQFYSGAEAIPQRIILPWIPGGERLQLQSISLVAEMPAEPDAPGMREPTFATPPQRLRQTSESSSAETTVNAPEKRAEPFNAALAGYAGDDEDDFDLSGLEELLSRLRGAAVRICAPQDDQESRLINIAASNAKEAAMHRSQSDIGVLLAAAFQRTEPVERIEAVDVSHTSGSATRAGMVVFQSGEPLHNDWRNYAFDEGHGDDYGILMAWAERRIKDGPPWPDLLLIDGGRGQLNAVFTVFSQHGLGTAFPIAGIAKARDETGRSDRRAGNVSDRIFLPGRSNPMNLKSGSQELLFLQHVRNHVHDFVIGRHRRARSNQAFVGELTRIPGFGNKLVSALWERFDSLKAMLEADDETLRGVPGMGTSRIQALRTHLKLVLDEQKEKSE